MLSEQVIEAIVRKYVDNKEVIAIGTSETTPNILKKFAYYIEEKGTENYFIPTSTNNSLLLTKLGLKTKSIDEEEIDLAIEFSEQIDWEFNYLKRESLSLVRDKMIAKSAEELVVVAEEKNYVQKLTKKVAIEITPFGWKKTMLHLQGLGKAELRKIDNLPFRTETGNYIADLEFDPIYSLEEMDYFAKDIPGVLETGFFIGYCDRIILEGDKLQIKSRMDWKDKNPEKEEEVVLFRKKPV